MNTDAIHGECSILCVTALWYMWNGNESVRPSAYGIRPV